MSKSPDPVLSLDTLITRPRIVIDDVSYDILSPDEISVAETQRFGSMLERAQKLNEEFGEPAGKELQDLIGQIARRVAVGVPDEVFEKLSGAHKQAIADVFIALQLRSRLGVVGAMAKASGIPLIGEMLQLGSSVSMADIPAGGFWKRLRRWFGLTSK